jgi:hypothetical protein
MSSFTAYQSSARHPTVIYPADTTDQQTPIAPTSVYDNHRMQMFLHANLSNGALIRTRVRSSPIEYEETEATCIQIVSYDLHLQLQRIVALTRDESRIDEIIEAEIQRIQKLDSTGREYKLMQYRFECTDAFDHEPDVRN